MTTTPNPNHPTPLADIVLAAAKTVAAKQQRTGALSYGDAFATARRSITARYKGVSKSGRDRMATRAVSVAIGGIEEITEHDGTSSIVGAGTDEQLAEIYALRADGITTADGRTVAIEYRADGYHVTDTDPGRDEHADHLFAAWRIAVMWIEHAGGPAPEAPAEPQTAAERRGYTITTRVVAEGHVPPRPEPTPDAEAVDVADAVRDAVEASNPSTAPATIRTSPDWQGVAAECSACTWWGISPTQDGAFNMGSQHLAEAHPEAANAYPRDAEAAAKPCRECSAPVDADEHAKLDGHCPACWQDVEALLATLDDGDDLPRCTADGPHSFTAAGCEWCGLSEAAWHDAIDAAEANDDDAETAKPCYWCADWAKPAPCCEHRCPDPDFCPVEHPDPEAVEYAHALRRGVVCKSGHVVTVHNPNPGAWAATWTRGPVMAPGWADPLDDRTTAETLTPTEAEAIAEALAMIETYDGADIAATFGVATPVAAQAAELLPRLDALRARHVVAVGDYMTADADTKAAALAHVDAVAVPMDDALDAWHALGVGAPPFVPDPAIAVAEAVAKADRSVVAAAAMSAACDAYGPDAPTDTLAAVASAAVMAAHPDYPDTTPSAVGVESVTVGGHTATISPTRGAWLVESPEGSTYVPGHAEARSTAAAMLGRLAEADALAALDDWPEGLGIIDVVRVGFAGLDADGETIPELIGERTYWADDDGYTAAHDYAAELADAHGLTSGEIHGPYGTGHYGDEHPMTSAYPAVIVETLTGDDADAYRPALTAAEHAHDGDDIGGVGAM